MKKTIVIIILLIYIASIAVVNFFGLEVKVFDGITYVESIQCNTITLRNENPVTLSPKQTLGGKPLFIFDFVPAPEDQPYTDDDNVCLFHGVEDDIFLLVGAVTVNTEDRLGELCL